jgi:transcriptional regulator with XRE-family HTH domain
VDNWQPHETVGDRLRVGRARKRLTLRKTAETVGVSASYLSDIENGRKIPSEEVVRAVAKALDLDADDLMAAAGRMGEEADDYIRANPEAGILFRRLSQSGVGSEGLRRLIEQVPDLPREPRERHR